MTNGTAFDWEAVLDRLSSFYHTGDWRTPYLRDHAENPFQVLIGTILSQRTRDEATDAASARLFARYPDAVGLASASPRTLEPLIRETGFYHTKARTIRECAAEILDRFSGTVPRTFEELTSLPGVGPKTANCVLVFGYGIPAIPVDTHVHRIANRLGVVRTRSPEETEQRLREVLPREYWIPLNPLLVQHGQNLCRPNRPRCPECPIVRLCTTGRALSEGRAPPRLADRPRRLVRSGRGPQGRAASRGSLTPRTLERRRVTGPRRPNRRGAKRTRRR
ncbi:MAG: endonuclease III [Thermoplasmata archaeon]